MPLDGGECMMIQKPSLPKQSPLLDKIKNGDFNYSHYNYQAMWCEHEMNKVHDKYGFDDMGRYVEETSLLRSRRKRLLEDHYREEDNRLESINIELSKAFRITKRRSKSIYGRVWRYFRRIIYSFRTKISL